MNYRYEDADGIVELSPHYLDTMKLPIKIFETNGTEPIQVLTQKLDVQWHKDRLVEQGLMVQYHTKTDTQGYKDHINPSHYQGYINIPEIEFELQWLETMQYLPRFRNPEVFIGALELQGRKYWDRNGGKDEELQELTKGVWYFKFLLAYIKNGRKPIRVADINRLIGDMGQGRILTKDELKENQENNRIIDKAIEDYASEFKQQMNELLGRIAELTIDIEKRDKELIMLRTYAAETADGYSESEWSDSSLTKEEIEIVKSYSKR